MITKKLKEELFAWDPNAFQGKGYWFVMGEKGALGRAATKEQANFLGKPMESQTVPESPKVHEHDDEEEHEYAKAEKTRNTSIGDLIARKIIAGGGIKESIKDSFSDKTNAMKTGFKETFDPLNMAKALTGGSNWAPAMLGKMMGRKQEDLEYFTDMKKEKPKSNNPASAVRAATDPLYSSTSSRRVVAVRKNDSLANVVTKLYALIKKDIDDKTLQRELDRDFERGREDKKKKRHDDLVKAIRGMSVGVGDGSVPEDDSSILDSILSALGLGAIFKKIWGAVKGILRKIPGVKNLKFLQEGAEGAEAVAEGAEGAKVTAEAAEGTKAISGLGEGAKVVAEGAEATKIIGEAATATKVGAEGLATASKVSKVLTAAKGVLEFLNKIPGLNLIASGASLLADVALAISEFESGKINEQQLKKAVTEALGGAMGGLGGAELGALIGGFAGSFVPLIGNVIGGAVGGVGGFFGGEYVGKKAAGALFDHFENTPQKQLKNEIDNMRPQATPVQQQNKQAAQTGMRGRGAQPLQQQTAPAQQPQPTLPSTGASAGRGSVNPPMATATPTSVPNTTGERVNGAMKANAEHNDNAKVASAEPVVTNTTKTYNSGKEGDVTFDVPASARHDDTMLSAIQKMMVRLV